jgi:ABC-type sugar transport system substrate-binding protein/ABC-type branched-subunit amino acid transport system substrate-binding protein
MKKNFKILMLVVLIMSLLLGACVSEEAPTESAEEQDVATEVEEEAVEEEAEAVDVIKIGALYPLTGPDAGWAGEPYIKSHQFAIDQINESGGIECLGGAKLELVEGDTQSKAEFAVSEMERLITEENVVAVMGSVLSGSTLPASEVAEKYEVPYIVPNALDGTITSRGLDYVFQTVSTLQAWGQNDVAWAKENGAETAVITVPNITFGEEVQHTWESAAEEEGLELLGNFTYEANTSDFTSTILRVQDLNPDVWFLLGNAETPTLVKQVKEQGFWPNYGIITLGSGFATSVFLDQVGADLAEGIIFTMDFAPVSTLDVSEDLLTEFKEYTGQDLGGTYNTTYASTWLLADALEEACSTDPKVITDTLKNTTFEEGEWNFQWPQASFTEEGRLEQAATVIGQWQEGEMVAIWPDDLAGAEALWPVPGWENREGIEYTEVETTDDDDTGVMDIINSPEVNEAALASDYSQAILADVATDVDTSQYATEGPYVIATSNQDSSNGWGNTYNVSISAYGEQLLAEGVLAEPLIQAITNDANQQISDIETFIQQQPDAIVVQPLGRAASTTVIKRAIDEGIPVVLCANGIEGDDFTSRVDIDFYEVAYKSGVGLAELMGEEGKVVVFNGIAGVDSTETWYAAAMDALSNYPDIEIIAVEYAQWNIATAKQKMEAIMAANPDIDGVWAGGGEMALGAGLAFEDAGIEPPKFAMVNVPNGFLRLAQEYNYEFVGSPDPPSMSKYCLQTAVDILQGKEGIKKFISLRTLMDGTDPYDHTDYVQWYVPELNDDFIPPITVDIQYYIDGGFERK